MCRVCENYRKYLEHLDQPNFGELLEGEDFIGNGGHVMSPSTDVLQAWEEAGCEPWYNGRPGGWYTACDAMDQEDDTDAQEAFACYHEWADEQREPIVNRRAAVMATREKFSR